MSKYTSSAIFRVLVATMQATGCFVYSWPIPSRPGPNPALCAWAVVVQLCLLAWLCFEMFIEVGHHSFLCIGEIAHVIAVLINLTALGLLPAMLTVRSKLMCKVLSGFGDIPHSRGPTYMSRMSQFFHVFVIIAAFVLITWAYVIGEVMDPRWKPLFAVINMFVVMRVLIIMLLFRIFFHSLAGEILHETQQLAHRPATPQHDLDSANDGNLENHNLDNHSHKDGDCQRVFSYLDNSKTNLKVDVKSPPDEITECDGMDDTWKETQHLDVAHPSPAGAREDNMLLALSHLQQKIYVVEGLVQEAAEVFCEPLVVFFVCFTVTAITGTFFIYLEGQKAKGIIIYVVLCHVYIVRLCLIGHIFSDKMLEAIRFLRRVSSLSEDERVKTSVERLVSYLATLSTLNLKGWCTLNLSTLWAVLSSMATYLVILLQVGGQRVDLTHDHE